jgi:hypothetical protein
MTQRSEQCLKPTSVATQPSWQAHPPLNSGLGGVRGVAAANSSRRQSCHEEELAMPDQDTAELVRRAAAGDELAWRRALAESEQRRQAAEVKLADCGRRLGAARRTIAAQDRRIEWLMAKVAQLRDTAASTLPDEYACDATRFFYTYSIDGAR